VRGLAFATLILGVVALILIDCSNSLLSALLRPNRALAVVLPSLASLLAVTLFWAPARDLFGFGVLGASGWPCRHWPGSGFCWHWKR
jgi:Ca2+-transporting ATPase